MAIPQTEHGYQAATGSWWSAVDDLEETPELIWPLNLEVYDRMRRQDAQVISVLRAVTLPIRRTGWRLDPNGARPEVVELIADDLGLQVQGQPERAVVRTRDRFSWSDHLRLALLMLVFGHSPFEQVYRIDEKGQARLRKLGWRPPRTISKVDVAADGGLIALEQQARGASTSRSRMDVDRLVVYVNDREGGNWLGGSLLRPAYKFWVLKDRLLRVQAQTVDRNGMGIPVYEGAEPPMMGTLAEREEWAKKDVQAGLAIAKAVRSGNNAGASIPHGSKLTLSGVTGSLPDADKPIRYYDEQIARAVLANFLNLGGDNSTGSYALGETFADFFTLSLQTVAQDIASTATQHIVEDLVDLNWGEHEPAPKIVFDEIGSRHPATAEGIRALIECKALTADDQLEQHLRTMYSLPPADADTAREYSSGDGTGGDLDAMRTQSDITGLLARTGFDAVDAARAAGLPDIKHTGRLPVTLADPEEGT
ncbi:phage portal protein family protein [Brachybacterium tyrofermentans]|uniref:phage portal protein family protein n=1 Tax=Brachybacterium tyrofermentans TaxID=47848 RepID=UPI001867AB93|nr:DUF935 family protein [Brachybacterium tyrofermentans]